MAKTAYINVRVEEEIKSKAEDILNELGINTSTAIDIFLSQIILKEGLPFDVRLPKIDYDKAKFDLIRASNINMNLTEEKWFEKILLLYAKGEIDIDTAVYAIKKHLI